MTSQLETLHVVSLSSLSGVDKMAGVQWRIFVCWRPTAIYCVLLMRPFAKDVPMPKISHFNQNSLKNIQF